MCIEKYCDGKRVESNRINLASVQSISNNNMRSVSDNTYDGMLYYDGRTGKFYTGWYYEYTMVGSNIFKQVTLAVAIHFVAELLELVPYIGKYLKELEVPAQALVSASISTVYFEKDIYHVNQVTYPGRQLYGAFIGQRIYARFYSDSARTNFIESTMHESNDPEEWPTGLSIGNAY